MYCTTCGKELAENSPFCSQCGTQLAPLAQAAENRALRLDKRRKKVAGVCAGFARYFDVDLTLMRVLWLGIALCTGVGFIVYLAAWIILPADPEF